MDNNHATPPHEAMGAQLHYRSQLDQGIFCIQRCESCNQAIFYPRMLCPHCGSDALQWFTPSGQGTVYSTTVVRRKAEHGGDYNVALIDLPEGVRMMSRVEGVPPADVKIGMHVRLKLIDHTEGKLVIFTPGDAR